MMGATVANTKTVKFSEIEIGQSFCAWRGESLEYYKKIDDANSFDNFGKDRLFSSDDEVYIDEP